MKEAAIKEKADLEKRIVELEKQKNLEKDELKERIAELEKQQIDEKKEKDDLLERNLKLEKEINEEKTMKNKYEKEKDHILDFLAREVTCSVCLMIPRTKKIPICRNGHTTCKTCKRTVCPLCKTKMEEETMFSPLTQNITDLLAVSCIFMDQGCTIKLKKSEIVTHEKEECRELMCPGCEEKFEAFLPRSFSKLFTN
ncbi:uncharacterized protein LOC111708982 [Eurytemora carolleeae]|uniref:uncharacterized protein LOC111708982 n=1 Tax=Eurytemora carolleeae TaxID=1294199 RepID=UPI000C775FB7|nr:uncharacterized protein LOC111708982 [Eurytemora carolleeae]|eukprot:XP_023338281.1 uncharacterized protein LOC111708982 [Eurytemora affinis]